MGNDVIISDYSRIFIIEGGARPDHTPIYHGQWKAGAVSWDQGDQTSIYVPDPNKYKAFKVVGKVEGEPSNPEMPIQARYDMDLSDLLRITKSKCDNDIQIHFGSCKDPRSFNSGWQKIAVLAKARSTTYGTGDLGALEPGERAAVNEEVTMSGEDYFEIMSMAFGKEADTLTNYEVVDVVIGASSLSCTDTCETCQNIFALVDAAAGANAKVVYSSDGGVVWGSSEITTLPVAATVNSMTIVGDNVVVVSHADDSIHWADIADLLAGTATWQEVTSGIVAAGSPVAIYSAAPAYTWIVGDGGYIYFTDDPTSALTVQDAGAATTEDLNAIHGIDEDNVVAVGDNNAVVYTVDGGGTWSSVVGPAVGVALNTVWMLDEGVWLVGSNAGRCYYTINYGVTWVERQFPGSGTGAIRDFAFVNNTVGYMAHVTATPVGRILRTLSGGNSWYVMPESVGSVPTNLRINALAVCEDNVNLVYGGGLEAGGVYTDGILVKGTA